MRGMNSVNDIRKFFVDELHDGMQGEDVFEIDKYGGKTIEMLAASFIADEPAIFGTPNDQYINAEIAWYESQSTNVFDLADMFATPENEEPDPPAAWMMTSNDYGEINSNYGHLIYANKYFDQYENALSELRKNPEGRRATMIYNRPSIWVEFDENGKSDFICTNAVTYYIRNNELQSVVQMRSNDVIFGYKNDYAWQRYVMKKLADELGIEAGFMHWQVQNLHLYEKHFHLVNHK